MNNSCIQLTRRWSYTAAIMTVCFIVMNVYSGLIVSPQYVVHEMQLRDLAAAIGLPIIGGFCYFILPFIVSIAQQEVLKNAHNCGLSDESASAVALKICGFPYKVLICCLLAGSLITFAYLYTEELFYLPELGAEGNLKRYPLLFQAWWMWTGISLGISVVLRNTKIIDEFITDRLTVELFRNSHVFPFTRTVFWNALFFSIGLSLVPLLWIGGEPLFKDFILSITVLLILINLTFYPLLRVKQIRSNTFEGLKAANNFDWDLSESTPNLSFEKLTPRDRDLILGDAQNMQKEPPKKWANVFQLLVSITILISIPILTWSGFNLLNDYLIFM